MWYLGTVAVAGALPGLGRGYAPGDCALKSLQSPSPVLFLLEVLGQSRRSSLSGCQQCLSVTSSVLLSLFVSPIITAVTVGKCTVPGLRVLETTAVECLWVGDVRLRAQGFIQYLPVCLQESVCPSCSPMSMGLWCCRCVEAAGAVAAARPGTSVWWSWRT